MRDRSKLAALRAPLVRSCAALAALLSIGGQQGLARADAPGGDVRVRSAHSSGGSFGLVIAGPSESECAELVKSVRLDTNTTFDVTAVRACEFSFVPTSAVSLGRHCITLDAPGVVLTSPCFEVTGNVATVTGAQVALKVMAGASQEPASCDYPCPTRPGVSACTRVRKVGFWQLTLSNIPVEAAASYAFAVVQSRAAKNASPVVATSADFTLLSDDLIAPIAIPEPDAGEASCADVYARAFGSSVNITLGRTCIEASGAATSPANFNLVQRDCDPDYVSHWCADNTADCAADTAPASCARFSEVCDTDTPVGDGSMPDASRGDGGDRVGSANDGGSRDDDGATGAPPSAAKSPQAGCGSCHASSNAPSSWLWLGLGMWFTRRQLLVRAQRTPHGPKALRRPRSISQ